jgi:hypothetical protein
LSNHELPPIGAVPDHVWRTHRIIDLADACARYVRLEPLESHVARLRGWVSEIEEHLQWIQERERRRVPPLAQGGIVRANRQALVGEPPRVGGGAT